MMKRMEAANVEEAVALAERFKAEGRYNWFRGQLREWAPGSSLERKLSQTPHAKPEFDARLNRFLGWVVDQPTLAYLAQDKHVDALFAVLQHYGFPTAYIDFTTEPAVAGFFASDTLSPLEEPGKSVIYCLDTEDLKDFYRFMPPSDDGMAPIVEPVTVDVSNLWRLEAQHGHFLFANHAWHRFYDMDRIVFPWGGTPAFPPRSQIYPEHKSALEQLLDSYFFKERRLENEAALRAMAEAQGKDSLFHYLHLEKPSYEPDDFVTPLNMTSHWSNEALTQWRVTPVEQFYSTIGRQVTLSLRSGHAAPSVADQVRQSIISALNSQPGLRTHAVDWSFSGLPNDVDTGLFSSATREAWNGMRNLPYTNEDIASAISALSVLCSLADCHSNDGRKVDHAFQSWTPDAIYVEFGYVGDPYSKAYCSESGLFSALDPAWISNLKDPGSVASIKDAFCKTHDPRLMFDFAQLSSIFAREIIPSQLAMKRPLVLFNPADLHALGPA